MRKKQAILTKEESKQESINQLKSYIGKALYNLIDNLMLVDQEITGKNCDTSDIDDYKKLFKDYCYIIDEYSKKGLPVYELLKPSLKKE